MLFSRLCRQMKTQFLLITFIYTIVRIMHSKQMLATVYFETLRERILTYTRLAGLNVNT